MLLRPEPAELDELIALDDATLLELSEDELEDGATEELTRLDELLIALETLLAGAEELLTLMGELLDKPVLEPVDGVPPQPLRDSVAIVASRLI